MKRCGKILYLDQFAVSNMYDADAESHWGQLREVICQKISEGKLLCPMPLEHLYETVGRSATDKDGVKSQQYLESIKAQHDFFWKLARGKVFYGYEDIAAAEIIMLLKQGKVSNIKSMYIHKAYNPQIDILDFYDKGHIINIDLHNYNTELFSGINQLRDISKQSCTQYKVPKNTQNDVLVLNAIKRLQVEKYIIGLQEFLRKGYVKVRGVDCNSQQLPNKVDFLILKLSRKNITQKNVETLIRELSTRGFDRIPSMDIRSILAADIALSDKKQTPNDEIDLDRAAVGLRVSDYFFADYEKKLAIEKYNLDKKFGTKIFSGKKNSVLDLVAILKTL